ncbi:hypothetical protein P4H65_16270 [Paenibacillus chitinolyticus]|uniref:hypothetical protein n=1 Tax=Paenibacillus chitinolyticus TaxID=79263 RepID=UPI002DBA177E|nr:hypothetical protein [Paenibacillus chitinolyticus]MEC0247342.1 hypothetical protein [Paenibacillus chitinolyticus]
MKESVIELPTFDSVQVTGSQTIGQDLQVNGNETVGSHLNVSGNQTIAGSLQVNGSETIFNNLAAGGTITAGGSIRAVSQVGSVGQPTLPVSIPTVQQVRFYNPGVLNQPGLLLTGTDGLAYVLFVDVSSGTPSLAIQRA